MWRRWRRRARRLPLEAVALAIVLGAGAYVIVAPLLVSRYPLMTDLPQHAANASVVRHYLDADWHFREQMTVQPWAVPYMSFYALAAALMWLFPPITAVKIAVAAMLALLPAGLATLFWGMRKSPFLGVVGLLFCWGTLASWGFVNFVGALGVWAVVLGVALRAVERPWRRALVMLAPWLVLLFFTHPFRFPIALGGVGVIVASSHWLRKRGSALIPSLVLGSALLGAWWFTRPTTIVFDTELTFHFERLAFEGFGEHPYASLTNGEDRAAFGRALAMIGTLAALLGALRSRRRRPTRRDVVAVAAVGTAALAASTAYLVLPMQMGSWWFIYPREAHAALFVCLALIPDLPRRPAWRLAAVAWLALAVVPLGTIAIDTHRTFDATTGDFTRIVERIPPAPKLLFLVFDHDGAPTRQSPFLHLPAYVQATRGGWTSFSFGWLGHSPIAFRDPREKGAVVAPRPPTRWEWTPQRFSLQAHGRFYDWFLVRSRRPQHHRMNDRIELVAHEGSWWLYRRR